MPSNASKAKSGTRADFERQAGKFEAAAKTMLERHREEDRRAIELIAHLSVVFPEALMPWSVGQIF